MFQKFLHSFMAQKWENLLFLHWPVSKESLESTIPEDLEVDLFEGEAWLSVVGFRLSELRIKPFVQIPWKDFSELNLRTYVRDQAGRRGVWFYSLDSSDLLAVVGARLLYGLNYRYASIDHNQKNDFIEYTSETKSKRGGIKGSISSSSPAMKMVGEMAKAGTLNYFLLERYRFWSKQTYRGKLSSAQVRHRPYDAVCLDQADYQGELFSCQGFAEPNEDPRLIHYCQGFKVEASAPYWAFGIAGQANHR